MANRHFRIGEHVRSLDGRSVQVIRPRDGNDTFEYFQTDRGVFAVYTVLDLTSGEVRRYRWETLTPLNPT